ncbi:MAG: hypothetical protein RSE31_07255, partial [Anaerovoracaceae bacterium]
RHNRQFLAGSQMRSAHWRFFLIDSVSKSGNYFFPGRNSGFSLPFISKAPLLPPPSHSKKIIVVFATN